MPERLKNSSDVADDLSVCDGEVRQQGVFRILLKIEVFGHENLLVKVVHGVSLLPFRAASLLLVQAVCVVLHHLGLMLVQHVHHS